MLGKRIFEIFFPEGSVEQTTFKRTMERRYRERLKGLSETYEVHIFRKNGARRWVEAKAAPLRKQDGTIIGSIGALTDITERKDLEEQLRWSQKMEAVGRLAGGVAHDFNNLLTAIAGYAEMMLRKTDTSNPDYKKLNIIKQSSEAAGALTRQLLTISRRNVVQPRLLDVDDMLRENLPIVQGLMGEEVRLITDLAQSLPSIECDPAQLQQVLMNLVVNARDAMFGGGTLTIRTKSVHLQHGILTPRSSLKPGLYVVLSVQDTGHGMTNEVLSHLFEPFFTTKRGKGSGLGLSTIYAIVKQHRGEIMVESRPDEGTRFDIYFPAAAGRAEAVPTGEASLVPAFGSETILVAEDEGAVRELIRDILEEHGYTVLQAVDGFDALEVAKNYQGKIDVVLTDVVMPQLNGLELARRVLDIRPDARILFMSGYTDDSTIPENIEKMGTPFLPKPFSPVVLTQTLRTLLDYPRTERPKTDRRANELP